MNFSRSKSKVTGTGFLVPFDSAKVKQENESLRVPEIQMINKFYGLIPKKFLISERIRPTAALIRQKSSTVRPKTAKPISCRPTTAVTGDGTEQNHSKFNRSSSVDETKRKNNTDFTSPFVVTRRISFEKCPDKTSKKLVANQEILESMLIPKTQRIIRIDLNQMKWEEETIPDEDEIQTQIHSTNQKQPKLPQVIRKRTTTFQSEKLPSVNSQTIIEVDYSKSLDENLETKLKTSSIKFEESIEDQKEVNISESNRSYWTTGKSTEERRSKLQKSFSIHPSFGSKLTNESWDGTESESAFEISQNYPDSLKRTGRRSLHVEGPPDDIDTLISSSRRRQSKSLDDVHFQMPNSSSVPIPSSSAYKKTSVDLKPLVQLSQMKKVPLAPIGRDVLIPNQSKLSRNVDVPDTDKCLVSATEKRKNFREQKRCLSLPLDKELNEEKKKSNNKSGRRAPLIRQNSSTTKSYIKSVPSEKTFGKLPVKIGTNEERMKSFRPITAPNDTSHRETPLKNNKRQPIKILVRSGNGFQKVTQDSSPNDINRETTITNARMKRSATLATISDKSKSGGNCSKGNDSKGLTEDFDSTNVTEVSKTEDDFSTETDEPNTQNRGRSPPKIFGRASFSLDETSLLNYSTSIPDSIEAVENSLQSSKRRDQCLKIFEKMKSGGCEVRLETIFRGLMTPSEYRSFITSAENTPSTETEAEGIKYTEKMNYPALLK